MSEVPMYAPPKATGWCVETINWCSCPGLAYGPVTTMAVWATFCVEKLGGGDNTSQFQLSTKLIMQKRPSLCLDLESARSLPATRSHTGEPHL